MTDELQSDPESGLPDVDVDWYADGFEARFDGVRFPVEVIAMPLGALSMLAGVAMGSLDMYVAATIALAVGMVAFYSVVGGWKPGPPQTWLEVRQHRLELRKGSAKQSRRLDTEDIDSVEVISGRLQLRTSEGLVFIRSEGNDPGSVRRVAAQIEKVLAAQPVEDDADVEARKRAQAQLARLQGRVRE